MLDSAGRRSLIARRTVRPPVPESRTPIGRRSPSGSGTAGPILLAGVAGRPRGEPVAKAGDGLDRDAGFAARLQLLAQALDVRVDGVIVDVRQVAPDLLQELCPGQDAARVGRQQGEEVELGHGELDLLVADPYPPPLGVDLDAAQAEDAF